MPKFSMFRIPYQNQSRSGWGYHKKMVEVQRLSRAWSIKVDTSKRWVIQTKRRVVTTLYAYAES